MEIIILLTICIVFCFVFSLTNMRYMKASKELNAKAEIEQELGAAFIQHVLNLYNLRHNQNKTIGEIDGLNNKEDILVEQYLDRVELARNHSDPDKPFLFNLLHQFR